MFLLYKFHDNKIDYFYQKNNLINNKKLIY